MKIKNPLVQEVLLYSAGQCLCVLGLVLVYFLLGSLDRSVVLGGLLGGALTIVNFAMTAFAVQKAASQAQDQNVKGGQVTMQTSMGARYLLMAVVLVLAGKSRMFNMIALVLPLLFSRPILTVCELFRKKGETK